MKCPSCGGEIGNSKFCQFCGAQISYDMKREQEQLNKAGCPKCGSSNIQFNRENQGEVRGKNSKRIVHKTVGFCKDCGFTWYPSGLNNNSNNYNSSNNMLLWVLGWIFCFPVPVMILIWRKKNTWDKKIKIGVTVAFWIIFFMIGLFRRNHITATTTDTKEAVVKETSDVKNSDNIDSNDNTDNKEQSVNDTTEEKDNVDMEEESEEFVSSEPIELNSLQALFVSLNSSMTRDEIDAYIEENGLVKYAFTHDSAYYIGYDSNAIRRRDRDREGEAVDIDFVTSGSIENLGNIQSAQFANHTGFGTNYSLEYKNDSFYYNGSKCESGDEAMQKYLREQNK